MENMVNLEEEYEEDLQLFTEDLENLKKAGKWGKFISVVIALNAIGFGFVHWTGFISSGGYAGRTAKGYLFIYLLCIALTLLAVFGIEWP